MGYEQFLRWGRHHPLVVDMLLGALVGATTLGIGLGGTVDPGQREADAVMVMACVGAAAGLALRRVAIQTSTAIVAASVFTYWILDYVDGPIAAALIISVYTVAAQAPTRRRAVTIGLMLGVAMFGVLLAGIVSSEEDLSAFDVIGSMVGYVAAWAFGDSARSRRAYLAEVEMRAASAEARHAAENQRALAHERAAIARDLHDVVAHSMSVMVVQAAGARRIAPSDPARAATAMEAVETTGREALDEMRRILGVLRSDDTNASLVPQPGLGDLPSLIEQCADAGLDVDIDVSGSSRELADGLQLTVFRVVQESLTNTLKHAGDSAHAKVSLHYGSSDVEVRVTDNGRGAGGEPSGSGQGLVGMRERIEAYRGRLHTGPRTGGGFEVVASLPLDTNA